MTSRRPYLLRAMHEWISDNSLTPYIVVDASGDKVLVPQNYVEDGRIVLNVGLSATDRLDMGNEFVSFSARFGGVPEEIQIPVAAVLGIYARETGQGMVFTNLEEEPSPDDDGPDDDEPPRTSHLTVVK